MLLPVEAYQEQHTITSLQSSKMAILCLVATPATAAIVYWHCAQTLIHSGHFYSAPSNPLLRGAPDYSMDTVLEFHAEAHRQLQVKDLPKVPTWRLERELNPRPSG